jgi:hypothetical protein
MRSIRLALVLAGILLSSSVFAQVIGTPASRFVFDQPAPDLATANGYTYRIYSDAATTGTVAVTTCTGTASPFTCTMPIGAYTPGPHTVRFTAANAGGESALSAPLTFTFVVVPSVPVNPRIQ